MGGSSSTLKKLLSEIDDVPSGADPKDTTFLMDNAPRAAKDDPKELDKRCKEYIDMSTKDAKKATIRTKKKFDMDATQLEQFLSEVKDLSETPDKEVGDFSAFKELEKCAKEGWKFSDDSHHEGVTVSAFPGKNFFYYNICRDTSNGKFSLAVCYLISGWPIENNFIFYGGLIKERLVIKQVVSKDKHKFYLKF